MASYMEGSIPFHSLFIDIFDPQPCNVLILVEQNNNLRNSSNKEPANLDLFLQLDAALTTEETKQDVKVGFWHVPRQYNRIADALAKQAAELGDPE